MDKRFLEDCLAQGMSLEAIGDQVGKHPSTVSYWLKKHGLNACGAARHAQRGAVSASELRIMAKRNATLVEMADHFERSVSTVRYWLSRYGIETSARRGPRRRSACGGKTAIFECMRHGVTEFTLEGRGRYRCKKCRSSAVTKRRRVIKQRLVAEAGGACVLCGYCRWIGALQFHHLDPSRKKFSLSYNGHSRSLARSRAEARKCALLCANCHAEIEGGFATLPEDFHPALSRVADEQDV